MARTPPPKTSLRDIDIEYYTQHYLRLFWRAKWFIVTVGPLTCAVWVIMVLKFGTVKPELEASALVGLDNSRSVADGRPYGQKDENKLPLIRSRSFISRIVDKLSLRLMVKEFARSAVFDSVSVDSTAAPGRYVFILDKEDPDQYRLQYWGQNFGKWGKLVRSGRLVHLDTLNLPGMYLRFSPRFLRDPAEVTFYVVRLRDAIDATTRSVKISIGEGTGLARISVEGRDYELITKTVNTVVDEFVRENLSMRKRRTSQMLAILEQQLRISRGRLAGSENALRDFRTANPTVGLSDETGRALNGIVGLETEEARLRGSAVEADRLKSELLSAGGEDVLGTMNEALMLLSSGEVASAQIMRTELAKVQQERAALEGGYAKDHPLFAENTEKSERLRRKVAGALNSFTEQTRDRATSNKSEIDRLTGVLQGLPTNELRLTELRRRQKVDSETYSALLGQYNQAMMANAVEVADIFVMDHAVVPEAPPDFQSVMILVLLGGVVGLALAFIPVIVYDLLDKTARSETDLARMIDIRILETVPVIKHVAKAGPKLEKERKPEARRGLFGRLFTRPKPTPAAGGVTLLTAEIEPAYVAEIFRSLRLKATLYSQGAEQTGLVVTSLERDEGKSMVAANLAVTYAHQGNRTLLIDGDMRRGVLHEQFGLTAEPGLSDLLAQPAPLTKEDLPTFFQQTSVDNLWLIGCGRQVPNPADLLMGKRFAHVKKVLSKVFHTIILDTPPLGPVPDAQGTLDLFAAYIVVVRSGSTNVVDLRKKVAEIPGLRKKIIGLILNRAQMDRNLRYYDKSEYYAKERLVPGIG